MSNKASEQILSNGRPLVAWFAKQDSPSLLEPGQDPEVFGGRLEHVPSDFLGEVLAGYDRLTAARSMEGWKPDASGNPSESFDSTLMEKVKQMRRMR